MQNMIRVEVSLTKYLAGIADKIPNKERAVYDSIGDQLEVYFDNVHSMIMDVRPMREELEKRYARESVEVIWLA